MTKKGDQKRLVILDTHAILHRAYHALPDFASSQGEPTGALYGLVSMLIRIAVELKPDYIAATLDLATPTHRHLVYDKYKSHRKAIDEALVTQINTAREVLDAFGVPRFEEPGFEADDLIGTISEHMKKHHNVNVIIASGDMDTMQLIDDERVRVFTLKKGLTDTILYDEEAVKTRFGFGPELIPDYKGLRGDPSDNIPGVKGIGEKTATTLIATFGSLENIYKKLKKSPDALKDAGIKDGMIEKLKAGEEEAEFSKELATIRRDAPIHFELPEKEWRESIQPKLVEAVLSRFEFRSLVPRVKQLVEGISEHNVSEVRLPGDELFDEQKEQISKEELTKAGVAIWVLNSNIAEPTLEDVYRVGRANNFADAMKNIVVEIHKNKLNFVYEQIEVPLMPILRGMEERGVCIDKKFLTVLSHEYHEELDKLAKQIFTAAGATFNVNSPKQLGEVLFDKLGLVPARQKKTAGGARSTRESELEKMRTLHPIISDILQYRELQKLLSTYIDNLPTLLDESGRVHTTFVQTGSVTGRLATQNPGLQNIPIKTELGRAIRRAFVAEQGHVLISFDYSQIELRIAAWLSKDLALIEIFTKGRDAHTEVASRVFHVRAEDVSYEERRRAKVINFGILYGMGVNALREALGTTRAEAQEFYNQYFAAFPRLADYIDEVKKSANERGFVETYYGRRRYLDGIKSPIPYVRASAERMAVNAPMQGTQADIVKLAMIRIDQYFKEQKVTASAHMLMQVHDELVFEIEESRARELAPKIQEIMENVVPKKDSLGIPFIVEGKIGKHWGEMEKI